jgi:predicted nuclease of predicted toxin-antitoxin system
MRFLTNENFPLASVRALRAAGHDVVSILEGWSGAADPAVLERAVRESRVLVTFDRDYGELVYRRNLPAPSGILYLRFAPQDPDEAAKILLELGRLPDLRLEGFYTVVERERIRQRPLP